MLNYNLYKKTKGTSSGNADELFRKVKKLFRKVDKHLQKENKCCRHIFLNKKMSEKDNKCLFCKINLLI